MPNKIVAIHQPNFFPWLGYFDKIIKSDVFIMMDNVQFPKKGGVWTNRVKLMVAGESKWVTATQDRSYSGEKLIEDMLFSSNGPDWRMKLLRTIEINYRKTPHYSDVYPFISNLISNPTNNIAKYNIYGIKQFCKKLGIGIDKLVLGSDLESQGSATELLISMTKTVGGDAYLCGGGASGYQQDDLFASAGTQLVYQKYCHPVYEQCGTPEFMPGLSIIDAIFNLGFEKTSKMLKGIK